MAGDAGRAGLSAAWVARAAAAVGRHPGLWPTAIVQLARLARPGWWRRRPFLPLPDRDWLRFRLQTAYGDPDREPEPADVVAWLRWCRDWPGPSGRAHRAGRWPFASRRRAGRDG